MRAARALTIAAVLFGSVTGVAVTAPSASAGPVCAGETGFVQSGTLPPVVRHLPTTKNGNRDTYCAMAEGQRGGGVKALQRAINVCYGQNIAEDGIYGPITRWVLAQAVERVHGLPLDGNYDPTLRKAMSWPGYANGRFVGCRKV